MAAHALTHAHFDHYGSSHAVCEKLGLPLWCGADDVEAVEAGKMVAKGGRMVPGGQGPPRGPRAWRGRRGGRLHRAGHARALAGARVVLA